MSKFKKKPMENKASAPDIVPYSFQRHSDQCEVCGGVTDFEEIATIGRKAGFFATVKDTFVALTKLSDDCKRVLCYAAVHADLSCELIVGCRNVTRHHLQCNQPVIRMLDLLCTQTVCSGNEGLEKLLEAKKGPNDIIVVFRSSRGTEISREDGATIRHIDCLGFVDILGNGKMCSVCDQYRGSLRRTNSRENEKKQLPVSISMCPWC